MNNKNFSKAFTYLDITISNNIIVFIIMDNLILCTLMFLMLLLHVVWVSAVLHLTPCCITEEKIDTEVEHKDKFDTESIMSERSYEGEISCPRHTDLC